MRKLRSPMDLLTESRQNWSSALTQRTFRTTILAGLAGLIILLFFIYPVFFPFIEHRQGRPLADWLLQRIPAADVSLPLFFVTWGMGLLFFFRSLTDPFLFQLFLISYLFVSLARVMMIYLVPLEPPVGLIILQDPLISLFTLHTFISRDLFFSGHVSTLCLLYLCLPPRDKVPAAISVLIVATLLVVQHVHFFIDIAAAPFFTYLSFRLGKKLTR